jgi:hypothetical protein
MIAEIQKECLRRGVTRLCHFTPSRNLAHIAAGKLGILATANLRRDEQTVLNPTDSKRWDGWVSHVCCSIEYPNAWYLVKAQEKEKLFRDWVVLFIQPHYIWSIDTLFSPRNAAAQGGTLVYAGFPTFQSLYSNNILGAYDRTMTRTPQMLDCCPTDDQAEVLVKDRIRLEDIQAVAVRSEMQAQCEIARLRLGGLGESSFKFVIASDLFNPRIVSPAIRRGHRPPETLWAQAPTSRCS